MRVSKVTRQRKKEEYTKLVDLLIIENIGNG